MNHIRFIILIAISLTLAACTPTDTITNVPCNDVVKLIDAINAANQSPALDIIVLAPGCTYQLTSVDNTTEGNNGLPVITSQIVINGNGATILRSVNEPRFRIFHVAAAIMTTPGSLTLNDLTLSNGHADGVGSSSLEDDGGAILNFGSVVVNKAMIINNSAQWAGAIFNNGSMEIKKSTISYNDALGLRDGILNGQEGVMTISDSTISENGVGHGSDAIWSSGNLEIMNSTISGNGGNGIDNDHPGQLSLEFVTITNNGGVGVNASSGSVTIRNTLFGPNTPYSCDSAYNINTQGVNMDTDGSCNVTTVSPNSLQLGPLADNGGPTKTHALLAGSVAIDAATGNCPATDQRGTNRPQGVACDVGAYEFVEKFLGPVPTDPPATAPPPTEPPAEGPRCDLFDMDTMSLVTFDVPKGSTKVSLYVMNSEGWLGVEVMPLHDDGEEWVYAAFLGDTEADECSFQGYAGRLYCNFDMPFHTLNSSQVLKVFVNLCVPPIYVHERVSIFAPFETSPAPGPGCRSDFSKAACEAAGGTYTCVATCSCDCPP
jgi:hypothetical protein